MQPNGAIRRRRWLARLVAAGVVAAGSVVTIAAPAQAAVSGVRVIEDTWYAYSGTTRGLVRCNSGEKMLGGGVLVMDLDPNIRLVESYPSSDTTWQFTVYNPTQNIREIHGRAICATGVDGYERVSDDGYLDSGGSVATITATCPSGKTSIAGGFRFEAAEIHSGQMKASASYVSGSRWKAQIRNDSVQDYTGYVYAICTSLTGRTTGSTALTVNAGSTTWYTTNCGSSKWLVGGGWITNENTSHNVVTASLPTDATNDFWKINLANPDSIAHTVQHVHVCMPK
jgi:hypothetical protein